MAIPIKTLLLNEVKAGIVAVIQNQYNVFIDPSRGLREELTERYVNIFTNNESSKKLDLYTEKTFEMETHTWVKEDTDDKAREVATETDAQIQEQILPRGSSVRRYAQYFEESEGNCSDILYYAEGVCVVISRYTIKYRHVYSRPTQQNP
jgi:hypothetical protein